MKKFILLGPLFILWFFLSCGGGSVSSTPDNSGNNPPPVIITPTYALVAWSELGMHCIDGKDYSIFAVLPPYNIIHAQLIKLGDPPQRVTSGVTVTYEAIADSSGSINTSSSDKTNFWTYANPLFLKPLALDEGLTGKMVQSLTPRPLDFDSTLGEWTAEGIPTVPYDDKGVRNAYPMAKIVAKDLSGKVLAEAKIVLSVSDELSCNLCHASGANPAAQPASGWENNSDPLKDVKLNILKLHDERVNVSALLPALAQAGYKYQASLHDTALSGRPILCAVCHSSNALGTAGAPKVEPLTQAMHSHHAIVVNPANGTKLDDATTPFASCYLCHPGVETKCQRGAMRSITCMNCHGNLSAVGTAGRVGWMDLPACQNCHTGGQRFPTAFDENGQWRVTSDTTFATNPDAPAAPFHLYRFSKGHGALFCSACHGSPHAEFPTSHANDNVYSIDMQNYQGAISNCATCHKTVPLTNNGGPHGLHTLGQGWVTNHKNFADDGRYPACAYCHGSDYRGTPLSQTKTARTFTTEEGTKSFVAGAMVSCYDCHNGPTGG